METVEILTNLLKAAEGLTLIGLLFYNWQNERKERIKAQTEHTQHLVEDIDRLLEQTEQKKLVT